MSDFQKNNDHLTPLTTVTSPQEKANLLRASLDRVSVTWRLLWDRRTGFFPRLILLAGIAYLIMPIDLLPAMVVGVFGGLDDLGVMATAIAMFYQAVPEDLVKVVQGEIEQKRKARRGDIIDGSAR